MVTGGLLTADFNGDGKADLAFAGASSLIILPGHGDGTFGTAVESPVTIAPALIVSAHVDAGQSLDLVAYDPAAAVFATFTNDGAAHFTEGPHTAIGSGAVAMAAADFDDDGSLDVFVAYQSTVQYQAFYGHGDGTFESPRVIWGLIPTASFKPADMNGDGLPDLIVGSPYGTAVLRNLDNRDFGDPLTYSATLYDLAVVDLTGDGKLDVLSATACDIHTWTGSGIGTLVTDWYADQGGCYAYYASPPSAVAGADFDGDGRTDALLAGFTQNNVRAVSVYRNLCGDGTLKFETESPTISAGQSVTFKIFGGPPPTQNTWFAPAGDVTIEENGQTIATVHLALDGTATAVLGNLALGDHPLVAKFPGDVQYEPMTSAPVTVHVTAATTTTTLTVNPTEPYYGASVQLTATITSSTGDTPTGPVKYTIDGTTFTYQIPPAPVSTTSGPYSVGTHTVTARFTGDATHPPSSATINYVVSKQTPVININPSSATANTAITATVALLSHAPGGSYVSGTFTVSEGGTPLVATQPVNSYPYVQINLPGLAAGRHELRISYSGDANYAATDVILPFIAYATGTSAIDARGTADGVTVTWYAPQQPIVRRKLPSQSWSDNTGGMCCSSPPWIDTYPAMETVYLYRMESYNQDSFSNVDVGMRIAFTDDPLLPGTFIKSVHMKEILRAANILRAAANLPALTMGGLEVGDVITAAQVNALRTAINQARTALGAYAFPFTGTIDVGGWIQASQIRELREAVR
jgi:hypothetical protein